jgi:hypothetical protein
MVTLVRDLLRQDVHQPEEHDQDDRHEDEDENGEKVRQAVLDLRRQKRRFRRMCPRQEDQRRDP